MRERSRSWRIRTFEALTELMTQVQPQLPRGTILEVKPFFGGAAAYVDRHICISLTKVDDYGDTLTPARGTNDVR